MLKITLPSTKIDMHRSISLSGMAAAISLNIIALLLPFTLIIFVITKIFKIKNKFGSINYFLDMCASNTYRLS